MQADTLAGILDLWTVRSCGAHERQAVKHRQSQTGFGRRQTEGGFQGSVSLPTGH